MQEDVASREASASEQRRRRPRAVPERLVGRVASIVLTRQADGRVFATGDLSASFGHRRPMPDGDDDGVYAGWHWDGDRLLLRNDRYGFYPLFTWTTATRCVIASELEALLDFGAPRALDYDALAVFLRLGFFLGDDTPFASIRAVPPRAQLDWRTDGPRLVGQWPARAVHSIGRREAVDGFVETMRTAIARRLPNGEYDLPLSGGRDSRHLLAALVEAGAPPGACVTVPHFPPRASDDVAVAARLCAAMRVPHVVVPQQRQRLQSELEKNRRTHFCTDEHAQFVALADHLRAVTRETYDGIGGDVLSQSSYVNPEIQRRFERGDERGVAAYVLDGYGTTVSDAALARLVSPWLMCEVPRERAVARLLVEIRRHAGAANPTASLFFWNRTRREIALSPFGLMRPVIVHAPYLDRDVFALLSGLSTTNTLDRTLHTEAIARAYPTAGAIPYEARSDHVQSDGTRRLAVQLACLAIARRNLLRPTALLPGLAASAIDGDAPRLWHIPLLIYLGQLARLADARAA
jgi:asparagine synthase (glutamine-hydrolysing)